MLKEMKSNWLADQRAFESLRQALEDNTTAVKDLATWMPVVDKVKEVQTSLQNLQKHGGSADAQG